MFTGRRPHVPILFVIISLLLTACSAAQAGSKTGTIVPARPTDIPAPTSPTAAPQASPAAFGDGVLLYEWREAPDVGLLHLINPETGLDIPGYAPIPLGKSYAYAPSPDRKTLALIVYPSLETNKGGRLSLIDLQSWQVVTTTVEVNQWNTQMAISPDNQKLAIATSPGEVSDGQGRLILVDIAQRAAVGEVKFDFIPNHIHFTSGSDALMVYGPASWEMRFQPVSPAQIALLSIPGLEITWRSALAGVLDGFVPNQDKQAASAGDVPGPGEGRWMEPAVVFAPDKDQLYIVHAGEDRLTTVDFARREVQSVDIRPPMSLIDRLMALTAGPAYAKVLDGNFMDAVISVDGQTLYVLGEDMRSTENAKTGQWETSQTSLGLKVVRTSDGAELGQYDIQASEVVISTDGNALYLRGWNTANSNPSAPFTLVWDVARQETLARLEGHHLEPAWRLNREPVLLSSSLYRGQIIKATLDPQTYAILHEWPVPFYGDWLLVR